MCRVKIRYARSLRTVIILALLFSNPRLFSQAASVPDSVSSMRSYRVPDPPGKTSMPADGWGKILPVTPIPSRLILDNETRFLFDTLKMRSSKFLITRKLYDFVIVSGKPVPEKRMTETSETDYIVNRGKKIRKIDVRPIPVFGSDINAPLFSDPDKTEALLNKTHLNTNEFVIRKNLLFSEGDTISPITLSDNERIIRHLPFIDDARILVVPVSEEEADIIIITRDVYSLGGSFNYSSINKGELALFEKNMLGLGHEIRLDIQYDADLPNSPGFGIEYNVDNIARSFTNLNIFFFDGLGKKTYGFNLERNLISTSTKYAGGVSIRQMFTTEDFDTLTVPEPLKYNFQDYWLSRSFLLDRETATRLIIGARYTYNNVFNHPFILPDSYHYLQRYKMILGSAALSVQKYYKTKLIYHYGKTEDIPYGGLINITAGREINEFKNRYYGGINVSAGQSVRSIGYFYSVFGISTFFDGKQTEQGLVYFGTNFFSNLLYAGRYRMRNFVVADVKTGFYRHRDEKLVYNSENGFSGFANDSVGGTRKLSLSLESVLFSPGNYYGFRFAFFGFADMGYLFDTDEKTILSSIGLGLRVRNDNLVLNTFQIRLAFYPNLPLYSKVNHLTFSGEQLFNPANFDPGPPSLLPFR